MKKTVAFTTLLLLLFSCGGPSSLSSSVETQTLNCWSEHWSNKKNFKIEEGMQVLDDYLFSKGYLGKREVADYKKFSLDTTLIYIPLTTPGWEKMIGALMGETSGSPDVGSMGKCWEDNWFSKMKELDSTDVLVRVGKLMKALRDAGAPDVNMIRDDFFKNLTIEELNRPLIKSVYYMLFANGGSSSQRIRFADPEDKDSSGPPPPPPIPPPPPPLPKH